MRPIPPSLLELGDRLVPVEVKASATPLPRMGDGVTELPFARL